MNDTEENGSERRKKRRRTLKKVVTINSRDSGEELGRLVNLTNDGLMLVSNSSLPNDTLYQVDLKLAEAMNGIDTIPLGKDCLWTSPTNADAEMYWSGCHIIDISDDMAAVLSELIDKFGE